MGLPACCRLARRFLLYAVLAWSTGCLLWQTQAQETGVEQTPGGPVGIQRSIAGLGDSSYQARLEAERSLLAAGPAALPFLRAAAQGADLEIALRARNIIDTLRTMLLAGATVELSAEPSRVRWDEPFTLHVRITNRSAEPCRTPFAPPLEGRPESSEARQVGAMMDLADYLSVVGPDGREVALHTEPIEEDAEVEQAVRWRTEGDSTEALQSGGSRAYQLREFNRGWARYRMLEAGPYKIRFVYEPQWRDRELARRHLGRVISNVATVNVRKPAPAIIRQTQGRLVGEVVRDGNSFVAYVTNATDYKLRVNTNWGPEPGRHARLTWHFQTEAGRRLELGHKPKRAEFSLERIFAVQPTQRVELARIDGSRIEETLEQGDRLSEIGPHGFVYWNLLRRGTFGIGRSGGPKHMHGPFQDLLETLPRFIFTGTAACGPGCGSSAGTDFSRFERVDPPDP